MIEPVYRAEFAGRRTDEQLVQAAQSGADEALAELISRCEPMVRMQATKFCRFDLAQEDLAQEGLLALLSAVNGFDISKKVSFDTFASVCVRNRMIAATKKYSAENHISLDDWEIDTLNSHHGDGQVDPASMLIRRDEEERLMRHLKTVLTELEYQILLHRLASYSYAEISRIFQVTEKAVDNAMQRVRRKLTVGSKLPDLSDQ